jgi:hypothetical protein
VSLIPEGDDLRLDDDIVVPSGGDDIAVAIDAAPKPTSIAGLKTCRFEDLQVGGLSYEHDQ